MARPSKAIESAAAGRPTSKGDAPLVAAHAQRSASQKE